MAVRASRLATRWRRSRAGSVPPRVEVTLDTRRPTAGLGPSCPETGADGDATRRVNGSSPREVVEGQRREDRVAASSKGEPAPVAHRRRVVERQPAAAGDAHDVLTRRFTVRGAIRRGTSMPGDTAGTSPPLDTPPAAQNVVPQPATLRRPPVASDRARRQIAAADVHVPPDDGIGRSPPAPRPRAARSTRSSRVSRSGDRSAARSARVGSRALRRRGFERLPLRRRRAYTGRTSEARIGGGPRRAPGLAPARARAGNQHSSSASALGRGQRVEVASVRGDQRRLAATTISAPSATTAAALSASEGRLAGGRRSAPRVPAGTRRPAGVIGADDAGLPAVDVDLPPRIPGVAHTSTRRRSAGGDSISLAS